MKHQFLFTEPSRGTAGSQRPGRGDIPAGCRQLRSRRSAQLPAELPTEPTDASSALSRKSIGLSQLSPELGPEVALSWLRRQFNQQHLQPLGICRAAADRCCPELGPQLPCTGEGVKI